MALCLTWGPADRAAAFSGSVSGGEPGSAVVVVSARNDCLDPTRRPGIQARVAAAADGSFLLEIPEVHAGVGWLCAFSGEGPTSDRYGRVRAPRGLRPDPDGLLRAADLDLVLRPGPPLAVPGTTP